MDEELLISLVKKYPEIYDVGDRSYHDKHRRSVIWEEIGEVMNKTPTDVRNKWKKIRENFKKANKLRKTKSGQAAAPSLKPIRYGKQLSFLTPFLENYPNADPVTSNDEDSYLTLGATKSEPPLTPRSPAPQSSVTSSPRSSIDSSETMPAKSKKKFKMEQVSTNTQPLFQSYMEENYVATTEPDTLVNFFTNMGQTVKTFPLDIQVKIKSAVFNIVNEAEAEIVCRKRKS